MKLLTIKSVVTILIVLAISHIKDPVSGHGDSQYPRRHIDFGPYDSHHGTAPETSSLSPGAVLGLCLGIVLSIVLLLSLVGVTARFCPDCWKNCCQNSFNNWFSCGSQTPVQKVSIIPVPRVAY